MSKPKTTAAVATIVALQAIKIDGKLFERGQEIDPEKVDPVRLQRLIAKGRVTDEPEMAFADVNRGDFETGRDAVTAAVQAALKEPDPKTDPATAEPKPATPKEPAAKVPVAKSAEPKPASDPNPLAEPAKDKDAKK